MAAHEWSEKTRMIVTVAVVVVANAALGGGFYYIHGEWQKLDKIHRAKVVEKRGLEDFVKQGDSKQLEFKTLSEKFKRQESQLPEQDEVARLNLEVSTIAQSTNCSLKTWSKGGQGSTGEFSSSYTREIWKSRWEGDFHGWCKLMNKLEEEFPRFIAFEGLSIMPKNSGVILSGTQHDINVDVVTYKYVRPLGQ